MTDDTATAGPQFWCALLAALGRPAWLVDGAARRVVAVNLEAQSLLGRPAEALVDVDAVDLVGSPEDLVYWADVRSGHAEPLCSDTLLHDASGRCVPVTRRIGCVDLPGGGRHFLVAIDDHSEVRRQQQSRDGELADLRATLESTGEGLLVTDPAGRVRGFNRRFAQLWHLPDEVLRQPDAGAVLDWMRRRTHDPEAFARRVEAMVAAPESSDEMRIVMGSGELLECRTQPQIREGRIGGRVWSFREGVDSAAAGRHAELATATDALTGLAGHHHLAHTIDESIGRARHSGGTFALLVLDLDRFRQINDSLGERFGDQVLLIAAERLRSVVQQGDVVARIGDDRFALLVHRAEHRSAEAVARRVLAAVAHPCALGGLQFTLTCSVGVSLYPHDGQAAEALLRRAESAMQRAKVGGRGCFRFYQPSHDADLRQRTQLDQAMRQALACRRFRLKYQPQVDLHSGRLVGAEALIRWRDPELGDVLPAEFIPVAEETGFVTAIDEWVLAQAVGQAAAWRRRGIEMPVAINISARQLRRAEFVERVAHTLRHHGLPAALLEIELAESVLTHADEGLLSRVHELTGLGVRFTIDDFGTGRASLADLERFPAHRLKIDRRLVAGLTGDGGEATIVRAAIQLARVFGLQVMAEGVETEAQREFLQQAGCDGYQGELYAPGLDAISFDEQLRARRASGPQTLRLVTGR